MDHRAFYYEDSEHQHQQPDEDSLVYGDDDDEEDESSLDFYDPDEIHYEQQQQQSFDLVANCLRPTLSDALWQFLVPILVANLVARILVFLVDRLLLGRILQRIDSRSSKILVFLLLNLKNFIMIFCGLGLLGYHFRQDTVPFQAFILGAILASGLLIPALLHYGPSGVNSPLGVIVLWTASLTLVSINEAAVFLTAGTSAFIKLRPNVMLIVMKSISYFYETQATIQVTTKGHASSGRLAITAFIRTTIDFLAYQLHPSALILGVWHPHEASTPVVTGPQRTWIPNLTNGPLRAIVSFALCLVFLLVSSCLLDYYLVGIAYGVIFDLLELFIPLAIAHPLQLGLIAYSTAIQFHYSHYFICFAAQSMFDLWDIRLTITRPLSIELPRSLVDVVIAWNIPMHHWLKRYVFQPFKRYCSSNMVATILFTYLISSYLHGFNFQIWTVLLTLGLLTQAEYKLRHRLADIFSACIESRTCQYLSYEVEADEADTGSRRSSTKIKCTKANHQHTGQSLFSLVRLTNVAFTLLALVNLAFLGSTFDGKPDSANLANVWFIWKGLYFYSHIIAAVMFALYKAI